MRKVDFFYDLGSPYSYLAATQLKRLHGLAEVRWRPFLIGGVFKATGNSAPATVPAKGTYLFKDLQRLSAYYAVPFAMPKNFPANTLLAMRCLNAVEVEVLPAISMAMFEAYWVEGRDIADPEVLTDLLGSEVVRLASTDRVKLALKDTTDEAVMRGAFGAPTMFLEDDMYFGEDRLFLLEHALRQGT